MAHKQKPLFNRLRWTKINVYVSNSSGEPGRSTHRPSPRFACSFVCGWNLHVGNRSCLGSSSSHTESTPRLLCLSHSHHYAAGTSRERSPTSTWFTLDNYPGCSTKAFESSPKKITCLCALFIPEIKQACLKAKPRGFDKGSGYVDIRRKSSIRPDSANTVQREEELRLPWAKKIIMIKDNLIFGSKSFSEYAACFIMFQQWFSKDRRSDAFWLETEMEHILKCKKKKIVCVWTL